MKRVVEYATEEVRRCWVTPGMVIKGGQNAPPMAGEQRPAPPQGSNGKQLRKKRKATP